MIIYVKQDSI